MLPDFFNKIKQNLSQSGEVVIHCRITPSASVSKVLEIMADQTIKIAIAAPPEKGKANKEVVRFLAQELEVEKFNIEIISGVVTKNKLIRIKK